MQTQVEPRSTAGIILAARQAQKLTTREMANVLEVSQNAISLWENGVNAPTDERIKTWLADPRDWVKQMGRAIFWLRHGAQISALANEMPETKPEQP